MDMVTVKEAAEALGITERAVRYRIEQELLKAERAGPWMWLISKKELARARCEELKPGPKPKGKAKPRRPPASPEEP